MTTKRQALMLLALGILLGAGIWVLSPWLIGTIEPWDAEAPVWGISWLAVAFLGGLAGRVCGVCLPIGYAIGQMLITIRSPFGEFGILGWSFIAGYALAAVVITLAIVGLVTLIRHFRMKADERR